MANGKSETRGDAETGILKSETETKKCNDLIEKQIYDRQTQNLRFRDPFVGCARFETWEEFDETSRFSEDHSPSLKDIAEAGAYYAARRTQEDCTLIV